MKREIKRVVLVMTAILFTGAAALAQQSAPVEKPANAAAQDKKNGTGLVPPGVSLSPQMPGAGQPMQPILQAPLQSPPEMESPEKWSED